MKGVTFVTKRITEPLRIDFRSAIVESQRRIQDAVEEQEAIDAQPKAEQDRDRYRVLDELITNISDNEINPLWVSWWCIDVYSKLADGHRVNLEIDDIVITPANLRDIGPKALFDEVLLMVRQRASIGGAELGN